AADVSGPGSAPVVVISYSAWKDKFAGDPNIIGKKLAIRGYQLEVVGVAREGFHGLGEVPREFWAPLTMAPQLEEGPNLFGVEQPQRLRIVGRLRRGLDQRHAATALTIWARQRTADRTDTERATAAVLHSEATTIAMDPLVVAGFTTVLWVLWLDGKSTHVDLDL